MIEYITYYVRTIINLVMTVPKWMTYLYYTNPSHEVPLRFVWLKFSCFGWDTDMRRIRSGKKLSLGMPKAPQVNIQGRYKQLSLGMSRISSPLFISIHRYVTATLLFITWYEFFLERCLISFYFTFSFSQ